MKYSWIYCDTSAFLKLYVKENGSGEARKFAQKNRLLSSAILLTECYSALIFHENSGLGLSFLTSDKKQANAAKTVGLKTFLAG